jgi:sodium transport system permease protein
VNVRWRHAQLVARKELRETLRDRRTLAVMVLFPLVVYPLVSLVTAEVLAARVARVDAHVARVAVNGPAAVAAEVRRRLRGPDVALAPPTAVADIGANRVDAVVEIGASASGKPTPVHVAFDETREESVAARDRVVRALDAAADLRCPQAFAVDARDVAPRARVSGYVLSKVIPLVIVVMVMLGAFHPAIDITAGERERGTLETTLSAPIHRSALMAGKVLAVAVLAALTGFVNLASMSLTALEGARLASARADLSVPWLRVAAAFAVVPPTAFLFASVMVAIGALARSFKEAQTLLTPVYVLCMAPSLTAALGDFRLDATIAFIPAVGVTLLARDLVLGHATFPLAAAVIVSTVAYGLGALTLAARLYDSERLFFSDEATLGLGAWLRHLARGAGARPAERGAGIVLPPNAGQALALYAFACVLLFFVFVPLQAWRLEPGLALSEWLGLFGLTWLHARGRGQTLAAALRWRPAAGSGFAGAFLVGISAWLVVGVVADWILPAPKEVVENLRHVVAPPGGRSLVTTLLLMAVSPAICEEALFRGPILRGLRTRLPPVGAAVVTGLLFGVFHLDAWRLIPTALLGVGLSAIALATDSIAPAMLAHFINNTCLVLLARAHADDLSVLPARAQAAVFLAAVATLITGARLIRRARPQGVM